MTSAPAHPARAAGAASLRCGRPSRKDSSVLYLVLTLGIGLGLVFTAVFTAIAAVYLSDPRAEVAVRACAAHRRVRADPNEAARAVGSWG